MKATSFYSKTDTENAIEHCAHDSSDHYIKQLTLQARFIDPSDAVTVSI